MKTFKEFYTTENISIEEKAIALLMAADQIDSLNEANFDELSESIKDAFGKTGLKIHKSKGILDYIKSFGTGVGKVVLYIIKGDTEKAKELIKTLKKEDVLDFLLKLDLGTLHLVTGPIHMIDAWTGWELAVNMKNKIKDSGEKLANLEKTIINVKNSISDLFTGKKLKGMLASVNHIRHSIQS